MEYLISAVLGGVASWLQGGKGKDLPSWARFLISVGSCLAVGIGITAYNIWSGGDYDLNEFLASAGLAFGISQSYYNLYFKPRQ